MAMDRRGIGFVVIRVGLGVFFIFQAMAKLTWFTDPSTLHGQLDVWLLNAPPGSISRMYLEQIAIPGVPVLARLVPFGEFVCGFAMLLGFQTAAFAFVAFLMVLNYQVAGGAIFDVSFLANRSSFPVLVAALGLAVGGIRLPWSLRG